MMNLIKMDIRRMFKSRVFYALNIILVAGFLILSSFLSFHLNRDYEAGKDSSISISTESTGVTMNDPDITEELYYLSQDELKSTIDLKDIMTFQYSSPVALVLLAIFLGFFIGDELESGFIKNIIPLSSSRNSLILSKSVVSSLFIIMQLGLSFLSSIIASVIIKGSVSLPNDHSLFNYLLIQFFLLLAFSSLLIFIAYLFKSKTISVLIGVLLSFNVLGSLLNLADSFFDLLKIPLSKLTIVGNTVLQEFHQADFNRLVLVILVYSIIFTIMSVIRVKKMEIDS